MLSLENRELYSEIFIFLLFLLTVSSWFCNLLFQLSSVVPISVSLVIFLFIQFIFLFLLLSSLLVPFLIRVSVFSRFFSILSSYFPVSYSFSSCILQFLSSFSNSCFSLKLLFLFTLFLFLLSKVTVFFSWSFFSLFYLVTVFSSFCSLSPVLFSCPVSVLFWSSPLLFPLVFFFYFSSSCFCLSSFCFCLSSFCFCLSSSCFCFSSPCFC